MFNSREQFKVKLIREIWGVKTAPPAIEIVGLPSPLPAATPCAQNTHQPRQDEPGEEGRRATQLFRVKKVNKAVKRLTKLSKG